MKHRVSPDPLELVLVDGSNLAHALGRERGQASPPPAVLATLRAAVPGSVPIEVVFDGPPSGPLGRVGGGVHVRFAGRSSADAVIVERLAAEARAVGPAAMANIVVVTDDLELGRRARRLGARVRRLAWLTDRSARGDRPSRVAHADHAGRAVRGDRPAAAPSGQASGTSFGHRRAPRPPGRPDGRDW